MKELHAPSPITQQVILPSTFTHICTQCGNPCEVYEQVVDEPYPDIRKGYANSERVIYDYSYCCHAEVREREHE